MMDSLTGNGECGQEVDEISSDLCVVGFGIDSIEPLGFTTKQFVY
jgi:hypothetical protein